MSLNILSGVVGLIFGGIFIVCTIQIKIIFYTADLQYYIHYCVSQLFNLQIAYSFVLSK